MPSDRLFLISGATGNTGAPTVKILLEARHQVRAFVHRADQRSETLAAIGAEIVEGDLLDFRPVSSAMSSRRKSLKHWGFRSATSRSTFPRSRPH
jgi:NAD(P)H dehydrogenase (quinone)